MKRTNLRASLLCFTTIFAVTFVCAQPLPVDLAGNVAGVTPGVRLTKAINSSLKSKSGESLGQIQDLVLDPVTGQVQFAIVSTDGSSGIGTSTTSGIGTNPGESGATTRGQLVAIPWQLVSSSGQGHFVASVDRTKLQSAPTFASSSWPTFDGAWMQSVNSHYGLNGTGMGRPGNNPGTGTGTGTGIENPSTPGSLGTPGRPAIGSPNGSRSTPGTAPGSGTGSGTSGSGSGSGAGGAGSGGAGSGGGK